MENQATTLGINLFTTLLNRFPHQLYVLKRNRAGKTQRFSPWDALRRSLRQGARKLGLDTNDAMRYSMIVTQCVTHVTRRVNS